MLRSYGHAADHSVNAAFKRVKPGEVRFRYLIDMASLQAELEAA